MKFKPTSWTRWNWRVRFARKAAKKGAASLDGLFPLCFVPESSGVRRAA